MSRTKTKQVGWRLPLTLVNQVREEARLNNRSLDAVANMIVEDFFSAWTPAERAKFYLRLPEKVSGRPQTTGRRR